jgi:hypothetical protein
MPGIFMRSHSNHSTAKVNASTALAVGLAARIQLNGDFYAAVLTNSGQAEIFLFDATSNSYTVLGSANAETNSGTLTLTVTGSTLSLYLNGSGLPLVTVVDNTLSLPGWAGIFAWGAAGSVGSFSVGGS